MPDREELGNSAADVVSNDARIVDPEQVQQLDDSLGVAANTYRSAKRTITSSVTEKIEDHHPVAGRHQRDHIVPQVPRGWKAVNEDDRLARAARARRVVVQPNAVEIDELTAHRNALVVRHERAKQFVHR